MCGSRPKAPPPPPPPPPIVEKEPDLQINAKKKRDRKRGGRSGNTGLNRFVITPSSGSGASVPE